ncbi:MAG: DUF4230 domain-containing protein, partial [Bacteroidota bacterium]
MQRYSHTISTVILLILAAVGIWYAFFRTPPLKPARAIPMLQRIEYLHQLQVLSYNTEEMLTIGTPERELKVYNEKKEELEKLSESLRENEIRLAELDKAILVKIKDLNISDIRPFELQNEIDDAIKWVRFFNKINVKTLADTSFSLSQELEDFQNEAFKESVKGYRKALQAWESKSWKDIKNGPKRRAEKAKIKLDHDVSRNAVENQLAAIRAKYSGFLKQKREELRNYRKQNGKKLSEIKEARRKLENERKKVWNKYNNQLIKQARRARELVVADSVLQQARRNGEDIEPRLLIIVPASVDLYVDMEQARFSDELLDENILPIRLPTPQLDSVLFKIDTARSFALGNGGKLQLTEHGLYYDLYQQLKNAIAEKTIEIKEKVRREGVEAQAVDAGEEFVGQIFEGIGLTPMFLDAEGRPKDPVYQELDLQFETRLSLEELNRIREQRQLDSLIQSVAPIQNSEKIGKLKEIPDGVIDVIRLPDSLFQ